MRIAIDCTPLLLRSAGIKTHLVNWLLHMRRLAPRDTILAWPYLNPSESYSHEESIAGFWGTLARLTLVHAANAAGLPALDLAARRIRVFHASHQMQTPPRACKLTSTIFDMTCWIAPETHSPDNVRALHRFAENVLLRADGLIAISESSRSDAVRILRLDPDKIAVIYPGVPDAYFNATPEDAVCILPSYHLAKPYALFVGTIEPRKNVDALLDAWALLPAGLRAQFDLVVAGPQGWAGPQTIHRLQSGANGVRYLGYVPEPDLPALTAGATILVYPSLYEGFGLPLAQALAAGVPVVTSNLSSMPEVAGDAGLLVDPRSPSEIASAIRRLLESPSLRAELSAKARLRAGRFRWETSARQSLAWFRTLAE